MRNENDFIRLFSVNIRNRLKMLRLDLDKLQEIRMRVNKPMLIKYNGEEYYIEDRGGGMSKSPVKPFVVVQNEMRETMEYISNYSMYAFQEELRQGFITVQGGHRVGVVGKVIAEGNVIHSIKYISSVNIRISHEIKGCGTEVIPYICDAEKIYNTLIISPPGTGKTTLLRDVIRLISDGNARWRGRTVGLVDERSEIASCYMGIPQNDVGIRTDVLDCCPKEKGMMMLVRSMAPEVIAIDEIGDEKEIKALKYAMNCGCRMIATVHGDSFDEILSKDIIAEMVNRKFFERYIVLDRKIRIGHVNSILDVEGKRLQ